MKQAMILKVFLTLMCWSMTTIALPGAKAETFTGGGWGGCSHRDDDDDDDNNSCDCGTHGDDGSGSYDDNPPVFNFPNQTYELTFNNSSVCGNAKQVISSYSYDVYDANKSLGTPDGYGAKIKGYGKLTVKLNDLLPAGTQYTVHWRQETGHSGTSSMKVKESKSLSSWSYNSVGTLSTTNESYFTTTLTAGIDLRYIKFWSQSSAYIRIDAITYCIPSVDTMITTIIPNDTIECGTSFNAPLVTDDCDPQVDVTYSDVVSAGACPQEQIITRTYTATDNCGNIAHAVQIIVVADRTAPVISGITPNISYDTTLTASSECRNAISVVSGYTNDTYDANKALGAPDAMGAKIKGYGYLAVKLADQIPAGTQYTIHWRQETGESGTSCMKIKESANLSNWSYNNVGTISTTNENYFQTTLTAGVKTQYVKMWSQCSAKIRIDAITYCLPSFDTTITVIIRNDTSECSTPAFDVVTASDNCDNNPTLSFNDVITGTCVTGQSITRVWTATDACGNSSTASQTFVLLDETAPVISGVGANATIECPAQPQFSEPTASDECGNAVTLTSNDDTTPGACAGAFSVKRTWTATDACGNSSTASQTITVIDNTVPVLNGVGADETISCTEQPQFSEPTASDVCGSATVTFSDEQTPGSCAGSYSIKRTFTATDACGNTATAAQTISIVDNIAPVISGVGNNETIVCPAQPQFSEPTVSDLCDANPSLTFEEEAIQGNCAGSYSVTRLWIATDACGNTSTASQTITVEDNSAPSVSVSEVAETVVCPAQPEFGELSILDDCDENPTFYFEDDTIAGSCANEFTVVRTWHVSDACGNNSSASQAVTVIDNTAPVISGVDDDQTIHCPEIPQFSQPTAADACGSVSLTSVDEYAFGDCAYSFSIKRTWTATDACGNTATASQTILAIDNTAPVLSGLGADETIECPAQPQFSQPTALDECDEAPVLSFSDDTIPGNCPNSYTIIRSFIVTDACGNNSSASQAITVVDNTAPVISGVGADETIECPAIPQFSQPIATDACGSSSLTYVDDISFGECGYEFSITRTWTAVDACGNSSTASQTISAVDNTAPVISGVGSDETIECPALPQFSNPTAVDECDGAVLTHEDVRTDGACANEYSITRTWTATDACGNSSTASQTITVVDNTAPVISGVAQNETIECPAQPQFSEPSAFDACGSLTFIFDDELMEGACANEYSVKRTWTATDACGNSSTASQTISVIDNSIPMISGIGADETIYCPAQPQFSEPTASDLCGTATLTFSDATIPGNCANEFIVIREWTATDACGNSSSATQAITIIDNSAPVISGVNPDMVIACPEIPDFSRPSATDACGSATLTFLDDITFGECGYEFSITRIWTATDACGNTSTASQTITARDTTAPIISGVGEDETIFCPAQPQFSQPFVTDECDFDAVLSFEDDTIFDNAPESIVLVRTWTATDACGNISETVSQSITRINSHEPATGINPLCHASCDGKVTVSGACYSYLWSTGAQTATVENLCEGVYTVTMTDEFGYEIFDTVELISPEEITLDTIVKHVSCIGATDGSIDLSVIGGTSPYTYIWSNGFTTQDITGLSIGTYSVTVTDAHGCKKTIAAEIRQPAPFVIGANMSKVTCSGGNDGSIEITVTGGTPSYTFLWSNGETTQNIYNLVAGVYSVTVTDANGCEATLTENVTEYFRITATAVITDVACHGESTGAIDLTIEGGLEPYTFNWSNGGTTEDLNGLTAGEYAVTITDSLGCFIHQSEFVTEPELCDDNNLCTTDACIDGECIYTAVVCEDENACTIDACVNGSCEFTAIICNDEDACTNDACVNGECVYTPVICDDEDACTTDACVNGACEFTAIICNDQDDCTADACVNGQCEFTQLMKVTGFTLVNAQTLADVSSLFDGAVISRDEVCQFNIRAEVCGNVESVKFIVNGSTFRIEEDVPYSLAGDNPQGIYHVWAAAPGVYTITAIPHDAPFAGGASGTAMTITVTVVNGTSSACICDDADACTTNDVLNGECVFTPIVCDDTDACTTDACENGECIYTAIICDDQDVCTTDACVNGSCEYTAIECDDQNSCTTDACVDGECIYTAIICDDQDACTTDACINGSCEYTAIVCDDQNSCTTDACVDGECEFTAIVCDDLNACTTDACENGECIYTTIICDDHDACTTDACVNDECEYTAIVCNDQNSCTTDACENGECIYTAIICDDQDACTTDECVNGECIYTSISCDDENACTTDACEDGICSHETVLCDDDDPCTTQECVAGECVFTPINCDDYNPCTTDECHIGQCVHTPVDIEVTHESTNVSDTCAISQNQLCVLNFADLPHGTILTGEEYAAYGIHISSIAYPNTWTNTPNIHQLVIFNTFATGTWDHDLQVDIGNIAIFPENLTDANNDGLVDMPNDTRWGGQQIFTFDFARTIQSVTIVDHDRVGGSITAYDEFNNVIVSVPIPTLADGTLAVVNINAAGVRKLVIDDMDSGGVTDIVFDCENVCCDGTAEVFPTNGTAPYSFSWSTGDTTAAVENLCAGVYYVTVTDANGCVEFDTITINEPSQISFRQTQNAFDEFTAFPVPFNSTLFFEYNAQEEGRAEFMMYNMLGQAVHHDSFYAVKGKNREAVNMENAADGMYIIELRKNNYSEFIKVGKNH